ncbi:MAG: hypothetical protein ABIQ36_04165 [Rhodanobacter sp.]
MSGDVQHHGKREEAVIRNFRITATDGKRYDNRPTSLAASTHSESEFEKYRTVQDRWFESDFGRVLQRLDAVGLPHDGVANAVADRLDVPKKSGKKPVSRGKGKDKGNS